ncbi:autoinducer-2 kinase [Vagococcus lutrae]|uniref:Autoinducer-2 kinase n=1 Tax=Vagococcus lutrae TaxID=81947 RepID=A0AAE9XES4_9ENTE|nr:autoinducer-2 kinase [Vagococcus lutrae]WCG22847.1 autoinducer-2 kinase [Vagococcus lutrae]
MKKYLLAIDGGTGSVRAVLFNLEGEQVGLAQREWHHPEDPLYPGSIDFDCEQNWQLIVSCLHEIVDHYQIAPEEIAAISTTSMREGFVVYDQRGKELMAFSNVDARSKMEAVSLKTNEPELEKEVYQLTGESFALSAIPRILWLKNNKPDIYEKMTTINMLNDWIAYKLSGELTTEPSNASTTGLFSLSSRSWNVELADRLHIKSTIFPKVIESGSIIGHVTEFASSETGLAVNTPIVAGGGDAQLGTIGVGATKKDQAILFGGSFWQLEYNVSQPTIDPNYKIRGNCHAISNLWQLEAIAWSPGLAMKWFRDAFCQHEKTWAKENNSVVYDLLDSHIHDIPAGSYGMYALFSNSMDFLNLKHAAPTFINFQLDATKFNKYTFYKAIMESAGIVSYSHLEYITELVQVSPQKLIFAGGASQNKTWCQIIADIMGIPVITPKVKEATALGAALLAGLGVGLYQNIDEIETFIKWDKTYYPNIENHQHYQKIYKNWREIYQTQLTLADKKLTEHMWIAPGVK